MNKTNRAEYTALDFLQWQAGDSLTLTPKFQRRGVWKLAARSFFIDSILRAMPVPPIYLRQGQSVAKDKVVREVIDGQQRISAVLDYVNGQFRLSKSLNADWAGKEFISLKEEERDRIRTFVFSSVIFHGISDLEVLEIFSRLNTYSVPLNNQELRNGRWFGRFKQSVYLLSYEHLEFWRRHKVFSEQSIARMLEAEFVSELYAATIEGMQDKKTSLDRFYSDYDESFPSQVQTEKRFREVIDCIGESVDEILSQTIFKRPPLLYTLFCAVYHHRFGLPKSKIPSPKSALTRANRMSLREAIVSLSEKVEAFKASNEISSSYLSFANACVSQTDNIKPREIRIATLFKTAF